MSAPSPSTTTTTTTTTPARPGSSFAASFWSEDYLAGVTLLFQKLHQGVAENSQILDFIGARIAHESAFAANLQATPEDLGTGKAAQAGFERDEGASIKQAFDFFLAETARQGDEHARVAAALERTVRGPFSHYALAHRTRVETAQKALTKEITAYHGACATVTKAQQTYFAKARKLEDAAPPAPSSPKVLASPPPASEGVVLTLNVPDSPAGPSTPPQQLQQKDVELGSHTYTPEELKILLHGMLNTIPRKTAKLAILGSYDNVSTGEDIVQYIRKYLVVPSLGDAEKVGQGLVNHGFLRLVGAVGNKFSAGDNSQYQWQARAFNPDTQEPSDLADRPLVRKSTLSRASTLTASLTKGGANSALTKFGGYLSSLLEEDADGPSTHDAQMNKLKAEIADADQRYQDLVTALDTQRCQLEQKISDSLGFMQQCERDRMIAVKRVMADFVAAISKRAEPYLSSTERMLLHQQVVDPLKDLNYLIERYKTGTFAPRPVVYDNFFTQTKVQTFGVDLKHSAFVIPKFIDFLANRKEAVTAASDVTEQTPSEASVASDKTADFPSTAKPQISVATSASAISSFKNGKYRGIPADQHASLVSCWVAPQVPSAAVQTLRARINTGREFNSFEALGEQPLAVVVATLKEFLLELPDSLASRTVYDVVKTAYATPSGPSAGMDEAAQKEDAQMKLDQRLERLVGLLSHLPQVNVDSLQILATHFAEIAGLAETGTNTEEIPEQVDLLAKALAPFILRSRLTTALTMSDKHPYLFLRDLIVHRARVFDAVQQRLAEAQEARTRSRSASSSEANRRFHIEARNREIAAAAAAGTGSSTTTPAATSDTRPKSSSQSLRPLTLSQQAHKRNGSSSTTDPANGLLSVESPKKSHRRSLSGSSLNMFLTTPGPNATPAPADTPAESAEPAT